MKKYLIMFLFVVGFSLLCFTKVEAKSNTQDNVKISFGGEETLNLNYSNINAYKIYEDKSFYFDGIKHTFNEDYTLVDGTIEVRDESFTLNEETFILELKEGNEQVVSSNVYEAYNFSVTIEFLNSNTNTYIFKQEFCYKYASLEEITCKIDEGDIDEISESASYSYYYDFLPLYKEGFEFEVLTYKFSLTREETTFTFSDLTFTRENIKYQDYFEVGKADSEDYILNSEYNGNNYVQVLGNVIVGYYIPASFFARNSSSITRTYDISFFVCVGEGYTSCSKVFTSTLMTNKGQGYQLPIDSVINFTIENNVLTSDIHEFLLKGSYVCSQNCSDSRSITTETYTNEMIFHLDLQDPIYKGEANGEQVYCNTSGSEVCLGTNDVINNRVYFEDDNGIIEVYYYISDRLLNNNELDLINIPIGNGDNLRLDLEEGIYYLYFRVFDGSGRYSALRLRYPYLVDKSGPTLTNNNFNSYLSEGVYKDVDIEVAYSDNYSRNITNIYFLTINESDYSSINKEAIINANNRYSGGVNLGDYVSEDGLYRVCFIARDALDNYSEISCTNPIYLDQTPLTIEEVKVSEGNNSYQRSVDLIISLSQVEEEVEFKCGLFLKEIASVNESQLTSTCQNKVSNSLTSEGEGEYKLWIYASDKAGNYSILQFPYIYLMDNKAPSVSFEIEGNNSVYSNNVHLNVSVNDLTAIDLNSLTYQFYLSNYSESEFSAFSLEEGINYPFDYYGSYKIAIRACDLLANCKINTFSEEFLIDTGEIKLELIGDTTITILKWGRYKELGAKATKGNKGNNVKQLEYQISGEVNKNKVGIYYLTYSSGEGMNKVEVVREVIVKDSLPYLIISMGVVIIGEAIIVSRLFIKRKKRDNI